jgi:hypothetical protein
MASTELPEILLLGLSFQDAFDKTYAPLIRGLVKSSQLKRIKSAPSALLHLEVNNPKVIIVTDQGLTEPDNAAVLAKVLSYVQSGGLVIIGLHFPDFVDIDAFNKLFTQDFGLPWKRGDYHLADFQFNPNCTLPTSAARDLLPPPYTMKVVHIANARPHEKIFVPVPGGTTLSHVFPPGPTGQEQAAVVCAKMGSGFLAYVGDVNAEDESNDVILSLCGL